MMQYRPYHPFPYGHGDNDACRIGSCQMETWESCASGRYAMSKFVIEPHFRLQEWVAEEKGYFRAEGLDYEFRELIRSTAGQHHNKVNEGAFQSIEKGREADVSCACHWTVNVAASRVTHGSMPMPIRWRHRQSSLRPTLRCERLPTLPAFRFRSDSSPAATI